MWRRAIYPRQILCVMCNTINWQNLLFIFSHGRSFFYRFGLFLSLIYLAIVKVSHLEFYRLNGAAACVLWHNIDRAVSPVPSLVFRSSLSSVAFFVLWEIAKEREK